NQACSRGRKTGGLTKAPALDAIPRNVVPGTVGVERLVVDDQLAGAGPAAENQVPGNVGQVMGKRAHVHGFATGPAEDLNGNAGNRVLDVDGVVATPAADRYLADRSPQADPLPLPVDDDLGEVRVHRAAAQGNDVAAGHSAIVAVDHQRVGLGYGRHTGRVGLGVGVERARGGAPVVGPEGLRRAVADGEADVLQELPRVTH